MSSIRIALYAAIVIHFTRKILAKVSKRAEKCCWGTSTSIPGYLDGRFAIKQLAAEIEKMATRPNADLFDSGNSDDMRGVADTIARTLMIPKDRFRLLPGNAPHQVQILFNSEADADLITSILNSSGNLAKEVGGGVKE